MKIHVGFDLTYESAHATPMIFMLNVHPSRMPDLVTPDRLRVAPSRAITPYIDGFGNKCVRVLAPPGDLRIACDTIVADSGKPDRVDLAAEQHAVADLPHDALVYLLGSRYCETDRLMDERLVAVRRHAAGLAPRAGDLRFRPRSTSGSTTSTRAPPRAPREAVARARSACAATSRIWRSRSAAA